MVIFVHIGGTTKDEIDHTPTGRNSLQLTREVVTPAAWARPEGTIRNHQDTWYAGVAGEYTAISPWRFAWDFSWGNTNGLNKVMDRTGWMLAASLEYKTEKVTPRLYAWYSTGDDGNIRNGSERLPSVSATWWTTSFGHEAFWKYGAFHGYNADNSHCTAAGLAGIVLELDRISLWDKFLHAFRLSYEMGTNSPRMAKYIRAVNPAPGLGTDYFRNPWRQDYVAPYPQNSLLYLTTKDRLYEVNFDSLYKLTPNFGISLELGLMRLELDEETWQTQGGYEKWNHKIGLSFIYSF